MTYKNSKPYMIASLFMNNKDRQFTYKEFMQLTGSRKMYVYECIEKLIAAGLPIVKTTRNGCANFKLS